MALFPLLSGLNFFIWCKYDILRVLSKKIDQNLPAPPLGIHQANFGRETLNSSVDCTESYIEGKWALYWGVGHTAKNPKIHANNDNLLIQ